MWPSALDIPCEQRPFDPPREVRKIEGPLIAGYFGYGVAVVLFVNDFLDVFSYV